VVFIDADCNISRRGVELLACACAAAQGPVQCSNLMVAGLADTVSARLAEFAWRIKNDLRTAGYARLGLPCHLLGTGMAVPWSLIEPRLVTTDHLAEDLLFGIELALKGHPARFFRRACVTSRFPETRSSRAEQKRRWVQGHLDLILSHLPRLAREALRRNDVGLLALAADLAVPPLGLLAFANAGLLALSLVLMAVTGTIVPFALSAIPTAMLVLSLVSAWHLCGRDLIGLKEVAQVPRHILVVMRTVLNLARGRRTAWIRAERPQVPSQVRERTRQTDA